MPDRDFTTREALEEWAERAHLDHGKGVPAPEKAARPGDHVEVEYESAATGTNEGRGARYELQPLQPA